MRLIQSSLCVDNSRLRSGKSKVFLAGSKVLWADSKVLLAWSKAGFLAFFFFLGTFGSLGVASAQTIYLDITKPSFQRIPIAVPDFKYLSPEQTQLARETSDVLANDLNISGVFRPLDQKGFLEDPQTMGLEASAIKFPDWKRQGADFLARCSYQVQGNSFRLDGRLFDVSGRKLVGTGKSYSGDLRAWRQMVHAFADDIMLMLTGERGVFDTKIAYVQKVGQA